MQTITARNVNDAFAIGIMYLNNRGVKRNSRNGPVLELPTPLSVEYKLNFLAPAQGQSLIARGSVVRQGRSLIVTQAEVFAVQGDKRTLCALMQQTIMVLPQRAEKV